MAFHCVRHVCLGQCLVTLQCHVLVITSHADVTGCKGFEISGNAGQKDICVQYNPSDLKIFRIVWDQARRQGCFPLMNDLMEVVENALSNRLQIVQGREIVIGSPASRVTGSTFPPDDTALRPHFSAAASFLVVGLICPSCRPPSAHCSLLVSGDVGVLPCVSVSFPVRGGIRHVFSVRWFLVLRPSSIGLCGVVFVCTKEKFTMLASESPASTPMCTCTSPLTPQGMATVCSWSAGPLARSTSWLTHGYGYASPTSLSTASSGNSRRP